jgi:hypothetical protein
MLPFYSLILQIYEHKLLWALTFSLLFPLFSLTLPPPIVPYVHAAHAIIFGVAPRFLSPVKKMLRTFAMLYDFLFVIRFFFQEARRGFKKWCRRSTRERLTNFDPKIMSCAPPNVLASAGTFV